MPIHEDLPPDDPHRLPPQHHILHPPRGKHVLVMSILGALQPNLTSPTPRPNPHAVPPHAATYEQSRFPGSAASQKRQHSRGLGMEADAPEQLQLAHQLPVGRLLDHPRGSALGGICRMGKKGRACRKPWCQSCVQAREGEKTKGRPGWSLPRATSHTTAAPAAVAASYFATYMHEPRWLRIRLSPHPLVIVATLYFPPNSCPTHKYQAPPLT